MGCHCIEIGRSFVGKTVRPVEVTCWGATQVHPIDAEDSAVGLVKYADGAVAQFEVADLFQPNLAPYGRFDKFLVDPPREGAIALVNALPEDWPRRIVYVSCDPATLARDARRLAEGGYRLEQATPFDMFPQTYSIESVSFWRKE